jgi:hypothetical protein
MLNMLFSSWNKSSTLRHNVCLDILTRTRALQEVPAEQGKLAPGRVVLAKGVAAAVRFCMPPNAAASFGAMLHHVVVPKSAQCAGVQSITGMSFGRKLACFASAVLLLPPAVLVGSTA